MKKLIVILFIFSATYLFSQSQFSIMLNGGTLFPNSKDFKLGVGGLISLEYHPIEDFAVFLSSGYSTWGYRTTTHYNTRLVPIILGMKYKLIKDSISPYLSAEFQYLFGEIDRYYDYSLEGVPLSSLRKETIKAIDYGIGLGAGIIFPIYSNFDLNFGSTILLTAKNSETYNIRTMIGLLYNFNL